MAIKLKYTGKHMPQGVYEVMNNVKALLETGNWELATPQDELEQALKSEENTLIEPPVTREFLLSMDMKELRKWAKDHGLKSKDNDRDELINELLAELEL